MSYRAQLNAWDALKWFVRFGVLVLIFAVTSLAAAQFVEVNYDSNQLRADSLATRLLYTDAFYRSGVFDPSLFTQDRFDSRFVEEIVDAPYVARAGARVTFEDADGVETMLFLDEEAFRFHLGSYRAGGYGAYRVLETPVPLESGIGYYRVEVASG